MDLENVDIVDRKVRHTTIVLILVLLQMLQVRLEHELLRLDPVHTCVPLADDGRPLTVFYVELLEN